MAEELLSSTSRADYPRPAPLLFAQRLAPSTDKERFRFIKLFRAAQKAQETGRDTGYEFHTKPRYVLAVDEVAPITLGVRNSKPLEARAITETVCSTWKFLDRQAKVVEAKVCDTVGKTIPAKNWQCYLQTPEKVPRRGQFGKVPIQQIKIKHLLGCLRDARESSCLNQKEIKALIPEVKDARGQLEFLWRKGEVATDTLDRQVITVDGKRLSPEQLAKTPPALWNIEVRRRKISPAALRRRRTLKRGFIPKSTLTCFRAPRR